MAVKIIHFVFVLGQLHAQAPWDRTTARGKKYTFCILFSNRITSVVTYALRNIITMIMIRYVSNHIMIIKCRLTEVFVSNRYKITFIR